MTKLRYILLAPSGSCSDSTVSLLPYIPRKQDSCGNNIQYNSMSANVEGQTMHRYHKIRKSALRAKTAIFFNHLIWQFIAAHPDLPKAR